MRNYDIWYLTVPLCNVTREVNLAGMSDLYTCGFSHAVHRRVSVNAVSAALNTTCIYIHVPVLNVDHAFGVGIAKVGVVRWTVVYLQVAQSLVVSRTDIKVIKTKTDDPQKYLLILAEIKS